jgi:probable phosphoglycerate mutase
MTNPPERPRVRRIVLIRHGETEWSGVRRHTGRTDLPLLPSGEAEARALRPAVADLDLAGVFVSPLQRATRTAELAGLADRAVTEPDLMEWDYGDIEGRTTDEILADRPGWNIWRDGPAGGESPEEVGARADRVLARVAPIDGDVALVAHGHLLRVLTARWLGLAPSGGALFRLETATLSTLGFEHGRRVMLSWNADRA